ncbi:MAG: heme exporter protein CcmD [Phenylobacterium sp.]
MPQAHDYAAYIWPAYAISALVLGGLVVSSLLHARRWRKRAEALSRK